MVASCPAASHTHWREKNLRRKIFGGGHATGTPGREKNLWANARAGRHWLPTPVTVQRMLYNPVRAVMNSFFWSFPPKQTFDGPSGIFN